MLPPFDIFRVEAHCEVVWVKSAADWKSARLPVKALIKFSPGEYLIHSNSTNHHGLIVKPSPAKKQRAKPVIFQIAYDGRLIASRAELLKANGFAVVSVLGNGAAKFALAKPHMPCSSLATGRLCRCERKWSIGSRRNIPRSRYSP